MRRIVMLLTVVAMMVVLLAPMAQASPPETAPPEVTPPGGQDVSGRYSCLGPEQPNPGGGTF